MDDFLTTNYTIVWIGEKDGLPQGASLIILTEQTSFTITELTLDTVYTITVTATNECDDGPEFGTSFLFYSDTTYTTSSISPSIASNKTSINNEAITTTARNFISTTNTITTTTINTTANPTNTSTVTEGTRLLQVISLLLLLLY